MKLCQPVETRSRMVSCKHGRPLRLHSQQLEIDPPRLYLSCLAPLVTIGHCAGHLNSHFAVLAFQPAEAAWVRHTLLVITSDLSPAPSARHDAPCQRPLEAHGLLRKRLPVPSHFHPAFWILVRRACSTGHSLLRCCAGTPSSGQVFSYDHLPRRLLSRPGAIVAISGL